MSENTSTETNAMLDLAKPRAIMLQGNSKMFTLTCRRVVADDWVAYFKALEYTQKRDGRDLVTTQDYDTARLQLAHAVLVFAEGYRLPEFKTLDAIENWQAKLPVPHRLGVADILASTRAVPADDEDALVFDAACVTLSCVWSALEDGSGMESFSGLKHYFNTPTEEQHRRYAREASRSIVLGGNRAGTTVFPGAQAELIKLYDQLIDSVEGYCSNGLKLHGRGMIVSEMDAHHKVMAAQQLFQPQQQVVSVEAKEAGSIE
ncbi:MAG TPA: hypothetical protein VGN16_21195 [Acidobacteriaceae bacterium]|jgi:hypothetical protein